MTAPAEDPHSGEAGTTVHFSGSSDHPDWNCPSCPSCRECPGCDGGSGATPRNWKLVPFLGGKYARVTCTDCDGNAMVDCDCPCHAIAEAGEVS